VRAQHLQQTKAQWYDRNAKIIGDLQNYKLRAPVGAITYSSYTVPANRSFILEASQVSIWRDTAAGVVGEWSFLLNLIQSGEGTGNMPWCVTNNNVPQFRIDLFASMQATLKATGQIQLIGGDGSVGGTTSGNATYKGTEYDAQ
jgi:hypothetical protein